jgi:uncharacterized protein YjiS (DUF1127 family)
MKTIENGLHIKSLNANHVGMAHANFIAPHPAAMIAAARIKQSKEISRLILVGGRAIAKLISKFSWKAIKGARSYNKAESELKGMDDWALQDIGVLRSMISYAVRGSMVGKKYGFEVTAPIVSASVDKVATSLPANSNKIDKHHHAA